MFNSFFKVIKYKTKTKKKDYIKFNIDYNL